MEAQGNQASEERGRDVALGPVLRLLVRDLESALAFQRTVLGAEVVHAGARSAVLRCAGSTWIVIADAASELPSLRELAGFVVRRGAGVEIVLESPDPSAVEERARSAGFGVLSPARIAGDGATEAHVVDRDGYVWVARRRS